MSIELLPFVESDIQNLIAWVDKPGSSDLWASRTYPFPLSEEIVIEHLKKTHLNPVELLIFKIVRREDEKPVGHIELDKFDHQVQSARITRLFVDPRRRGLGIARRATELLLEYCFRRLNLNRVEILALETNKAALNLYEKIGFKKEGFLRENMILSGKREGSYFLSMLRSEYFTTLGEEKSPV